MKEKLEKHFESVVQTKLLSLNFTDPLQKNIATVCAAETTRIAIAYQQWYDKLSIRDKVTVHPPAGSGGTHGIYTKSDEQLFQEFINQLL